MRAGRDRLAEALRQATVALSGPSGVAGTGFLIAPRLVLTCAHVIADGSGRLPDFAAASSPAWPSELKLAVRADGFRPAAAGGPDLALLAADRDLPGIPALAVGQVEPGDELWAFGYPRGRYRGGEPVVFRYEGPSQAADGTVLLRVTQGTAWPGHSGSPVLNWRTGAICGVVRLGSTQDGVQRARLTPAWAITAAFPGLAARPPWAPHQRAWLDLLDDRQLRAAGFRYAGPRLRSYLRAARAAAREHPYLLTQAAPPLSKVYLRQQATRHPDAGPGGDGQPPEPAASRIEADSLLEYHRGAQVIGGPGAGKSSLLRYITDVTASRWLDGQDADFVPIRVAAEALCDGRALPDALAQAVADEIGAKLTDRNLAGLFADEPVASVPWLVLVDGVDELLDWPLRRKVLDAVAHHRQHTPGYRFIITSRPLPDTALLELNNGETPAYDIEPFTAAQLPQFARGWFTALSLPDVNAAVARFMAQLERNQLQQLARIPLIAAMMCVVFADDSAQTLPPGRAGIYEKFVGRLLEKHRWPLDAHRKLNDRARPYGVAAEQAVHNLINDLPRLLEELADYRQTGKTGKLSEHAATLRPAGIAPGLPAGEWLELIREVLRQSGVLVERSGDFMFVHQSIQEYLTACGRARQHPDPGKRGSGWLPPGWRSWPWPDAEITIFLAEIFISRGQDLSRPLARLMSRYNRTQNAPFIAELAAHGTPLPRRIRDRAAAALATTITASATGNDEWLTAIRYLASLDHERALDTLTELVTGQGAKGSQAKSYRRVEAALIVLATDPGRGLPLLEKLVADRSVHQFDRLRAARTIAGLDPARGMTCLFTLIGDPDINQHGYLESVLELGELDRGQALAVLSRTIANPATSNQDRIRAVQTLGELGYGHNILEKLSRDATQDAALRIKAAETLHHGHPRLGEQAFAAIAVDRHLDSSRRVRILERLEALKYPQAAELRAQLQADGTIADHNRRMEEIRQAEEAEWRRQQAEIRMAEAAAEKRRQQVQRRMAAAQRQQQQAQKRKAEAAEKQRQQDQKRKSEAVEKRRQQAETRKAEAAEKRRQQAETRKAEAAERRRQEAEKRKAEAKMRRKSEAASRRTPGKR